MGFSTIWRRRIVRAGVASSLAAGLLLTGGTAAGVDTHVPVRGGIVVVPAFNPADHHNAQTCQRALNAALNSLSAQLANIPFPPPGQPGYHEWANAIGAAMRAINAQRSQCLALGPRGQRASAGEARQFAKQAPKIGKVYVSVAKKIRRSKKPRREKLALRLFRNALVLDRRFDLEELKNRKSYARLRNVGTGVRRDQIMHVPKFAADVQRISDYDHKIIEITEKRAERDPELAARMDYLAQLNYGGRPYAQLQPHEKRAIASQVQPHSGALRSLLNLVRNAGKSASHVTFGR